MKKSISNTRNILYIAIAFIVMIAIIYFPLSEDIRQIGQATLTETGRKALGVLIFALILWMTEAMPFHMTGLLGLVMMTLLKVDSFDNIVQAGFGNDIIVFFIGVLILSSFITQSGLGKRISMYILSKTGNKTTNIVLGFLVTGALLSMWVTDMAVAAMLMPLAKAILDEEGVKPMESNFGKGLMIATAWGPIVGGVGTPAGCGANPLAVGFLRDMAGIEFSFLDWMTYGVPAAIAILIPTWLVLIVFFKPEMTHLKKTKEDLVKEFNQLEPMTHDQKVTVFVFLTTVVLWLTSPLLSDLLGVDIPISMPVALTAVIFFLPGMSDSPWKKIEKDISWSSIVLVVSGISLGIMLYQTGAALWVSTALLSGIGSVPTLLRVLLIILIVSLLKIVFSSNTVTGTIIIPIMIALADSLGMNALGVTIPAAITASLAFILVTSTPTNVIPYSAGYFSIKDMAKAGSALTIISSTIVALVLFFVGKMTGLY